MGQDKIDQNKIGKGLMVGLVMTALVSISACIGWKSEEGVQSWRLPEGGLEKKQALLGTAVAERMGEWQVPDGDPQQGRQALRAYGCASCHTIPGVAGASGQVGPPLTQWAGRGFIAGKLPNTPDNLIEWIRSPQSIEPGTAMPDMGVSEQDARNMAAWLYTLKP